MKNVSQDTTANKIFGLLAHTFPFSNRQSLVFNFLLMLLSLLFFSLGSYASLLGAILFSATLHYFAIASSEDEDWNGLCSLTTNTSRTGVSLMLSVLAVISLLGILAYSTIAPQESLPIIVPLALTLTVVLRFSVQDGFFLRAMGLAFILSLGIVVSSCLSLAGAGPVISILVAVLMGAVIEAIIFGS